MLLKISTHHLWAMGLLLGDVQLSELERFNIISLVPQWDSNVRPSDLQTKTLPTQPPHISRFRVNSPNTGCLPNIGNGPQSGPPLYGKAEGDQRPQSGSSLSREAKIRYLVSIRNLESLPYIIGAKVHRSESALEQIRAYELSLQWIS